MLRDEHGLFGSSALISELITRPPRLIRIASSKTLCSLSISFLESSRLACNAFYKNNIFNIKLKLNKLEVQCHPLIRCYNFDKKYS